MHSPVLRLRLLLAALLTVTLLGAGGFMFAEGLSLGQAVYLCFITITTVGYGDIHPTTDLGRALAIVVVLAGVGTFTGLVANGTERLLSRRERTQRERKLSVVAGLFHAELGKELLAFLAQRCKERQELAAALDVQDSWKAADYRRARNALEHQQITLSLDPSGREDALALLRERAELLLRMLENPTLLEHEHLTDALLATLHLRDELACRGDLSQLGAQDAAHIDADARRVFSLLAREWLTYMAHMQRHYPYLFSLAVRANPFHPERSPEVCQLTSTR